MNDDSDHARIYREIKSTEASHDPFSAAVHATRMPMIITDPKLNDNPIVFANDAFLRLTEYSREEVIGRNCRFLQGAETDQSEIDKMRAAIARHEPIEIVILNYKKHGEVFWNNLLISPTFSEAGELIFFIASQYDVTFDRERVHMLNESLAESELSWRLTPDLLSVIDLKTGVFERVNPAWTTALGWSEAEIRGSAYQALVHPDDLDRSNAAFAKVRLGNPILSFENRYRTSSGGWRRLSWLAFPQEDKLFSSTRDITAAHAQAAELRLYRDIIESDGSPVLAFDREHRVIGFNKAHSDEFMRVMGHRQEIGETLPDLFPVEQGAMLRDLMNRALSGEQFTVTEEVGDPERVVPTWDITYTPLRNAGGEITGAFHHARDISERAQIERDRDALEQQLRQAQKMEAVGQLTGGLAHDFNNLLAGISGSLELMAIRISQGRQKDVEKYIVAAQGAAKRAAALTHRLLAFSRRQTLAPKPTDVNALVHGMIDLVQRTVGPSIEVETVGLAGLWTALVDPSQLENALLNLCINARDAMPGGGKITVETGNRWIDRHGAREHGMPEGQYLSLCVSDTGTGMPPEVIAKAFDPFFTTKPIGEGTGLGLSMIFGFAKQSGGQVRIYSEVGLGTTVCIYLPRHTGNVEVEPSGPERAPAQLAEAGETVLIVDDEPTVRMLVGDVLADLGYTAIEAADGACGLEVLQSNVRIDLLVTDVGLPGGMNGRQMADAARVGRPGLRVLFITGFAENALLNNGQLEPGMAVLTKPFAVETLAARMRELISVAPTRAR